MKENDLKCCGNCINRKSIDIGKYVREMCSFNIKITTSSFEYCNGWEYDGLHREIRMENFDINKV